ncbi:MAG: DUF697 domain-containing protein [Bacilli bacterium]|nr:DUF697 domain-containing protein [Bacilli bacterium]
MEKKKSEPKKMTLEEYQQKYAKKHNTVFIKSAFFLISAAIGIVVFAALFLIVVRLFDIHQIAGYIGIGVAVIVFGAFYVYPLIRISTQRRFITDVDSQNIKEAKRHNKKMREEIADAMIDFSAKTENVGWYKEENIGKLAVARQTNDNAALRSALTNIYNEDISKKANAIIRDHSVKIGLVTALSQSERIDTLFVALYELNLIKQLVFLYGYRPSEAKLMRIYSTVLTNSLIAYGLTSVSSNLATSVVKTIGGAVERIPLLGNIVSTVIDSASQGFINGGLTVVLGFQTKKYLNDEFKKQEIIEEIEVIEEEEKAMLTEVKTDIVSAYNEAKKEQKAAS